MRCLIGLSVIVMVTVVGNAAGDDPTLVLRTAVPRRQAVVEVLTLGDYTYTTNAAGQATITGFNKNYTGALAITNILGGYPVARIGDSAFRSCTNVTSVTIPASVTYIENFAFDGCTGLTNITIPTSVTNIGIGAFQDCTNLPASIQNLAPASSLRSVISLPAVGVTRRMRTLQEPHITAIPQVQPPVRIPLTKEQDDQLAKEGMPHPSEKDGNKTEVQPKPEGDGEPAP